MLFYQIIAALFGALAILFGAFGAHALKKKLPNPNALDSYETAVRYLMYHALALLFIASTFPSESTFITWSLRCMSIGTLLFSGSIFLLVFQQFWSKKFKILGPITPIGGLFLLIAWLCLILHFIFT